MSAVELSLWFVSLFLCSSALDQETMYIHNVTVLPWFSIGDSKLFEFPKELKYIVNHSDGQFNLLVTRHYGHPLAHLQQNDDLMLVVPAENRQIAVYMDAEEKTLLTVRCDAMTGTCSLSGYLYHDGIVWTISPFKGEPDKYHAVLERLDVNNALKKVVHDGEIWRQHKENDTMIRGFRWQNQLRVRRAIVHDKATKTTVCNFIEVMAVADYSVWNFFLSKEAGNAINAERSLNDHYKALFSEVDLRYKCLEPERCVRVLLVHVLIQKTEAESWSRFKVGGNVNGVPGANACGRLIYSPADLVLCFTRKNIVVTEETIGASYIGQICLPSNFRSIVLVDLHDGLCRTAAKLILVQLGILFDGSIGCNNADGFIGSQLNTIPTDAAKFGNNWIFSSCSKSELDSKILMLNVAENNCLLKGSVTELELAEKTANQKRAGELIDLNHQCKLAVGTSSQTCLPPGISSAQDTVGICVQGVFCLFNGACTRRVRVYNGSPCGCGKSCFKGTCIEQFNIPLEGDCRDDCNCMTVNGVCTTIPGGKKVCRCAAGNTDTGNGVCALIADCSTIPSAQNGMFKSIGTFGGVNAFSLACDDGYTVNNAETCIFCTQLGGFTTPKAACIRDCGKVPSTSNGFFSLDSETTVGSMASLTCCAGYRTSASVQITCQDTAQGWSTPGETCTLRGCPLGDWQLDGDRRSCYFFGSVGLTYQAARNEPVREKRYILTFVNSVYPDRPVHPDSLIKIYMFTYYFHKLVKRFCQFNGEHVEEMIRNTLFRDFCDTFDDENSNTQSNLVQVDSRGELLYLKEYLLNDADTPTHGYWNDLFETTTNGNEVWRATGDPLLFSDWNAGQPDIGQSCTAFWKNFQYRQADIECTNTVNPAEADNRLSHALCEIKLVP